jgi:hypothetical protein
MGEGRCATCNGSLKFKAPGSKYCSTNCRVAGYRADRFQQCDSVLAMIREPDVPTTGRYVDASLVAGPDPRGETWLDRYRYAIDHDPVAVETFGKSAIFAAAKPISAGAVCCRFKIAILQARAHQDQMPSDAPWVRRLLGGAPCRSCAVELKGRTQKPKIHPSRHDPLDCVICHAAQLINAKPGILNAARGTHDPERPTNPLWCPKGCAVHAP